MGGPVLHGNPGEGIIAEPARLPYPGGMPPPDQQPIVSVPASCTNCGNPASKLRIQSGTWLCPRCNATGISPAGSVP